MNAFQIIDLHCDTIWACHTQKKSLSEFDGHVNSEKLKTGGCLAQALALYIDSDGRTSPGGLTPWAYYQALLDCFRKNLADNQDLLRRAWSADEILKNAEEGCISALLTVEDSLPLDGKIERVDEMYRDGVRMMSLTWNYENSVGFPNSRDPEAHLKGLKPFGMEVIERMRELGMVIDVSHLNEGGFKDVARTATKPFVASHSCARALCDHPRNLTDAQLKAIAENGGVVGINFCSAFLTEQSDYTTIDDVVRHLLYMKQVAGADILAWGSDFDGIDNRLEFEDYSGLSRIITRLEGRLTYDEIDKLNHENYLRVLKEQ